MNGESVRVLHVTTAGDVLAGAEQLLLSIARASRAAMPGWSLGFATLSGRGPLHDELARAGWPVFALGIAGAHTFPAALLRLRTLLAEQRPDILHVHLFHPSLVGAAVASVDPRVVLVQTRHYSDYVVRFRSRRAGLDAWSARRCRRIIAVSDAAKEQLVRAERVPEERVQVVENGVDWKRLASLDVAGGRASLRAAGVPDGTLIGCAGRFDLGKGHTYLLRAFARSREVIRDAELVLLGDGPLGDALRDEARTLAIADHVHFLGHRADAHALLAGLDIYVQPSLDEGFGLAVIEAMATRRPVVVSAIGGMVKTVDDGVTGLHVTSMNVDALTGAITRLAESPALRAALGERASESIRVRYSIERMLARYDDVYRDALNMK